MADKVLSTITVQGLDDIPDGTYVNNPESTAGQFSASKAYAIGDHVFYNRKLYKFTSAHAAGAWNAAHVTEVTIGSEIKALDGEVGAIKNDLSDGTMTVNNAENAEQLTSNVGIEDKTPYLYRTSGGSVDIGDREDIKKIVGGTIAWNQLFNDANVHASSNGINFTVSSHVITASGTPSATYANLTPNDKAIPVIANHVYVLLGAASGTGAALAFTPFNSSFVPTSSDVSASKVYKVSAETVKVLLRLIQMTVGTAINVNYSGVKFTDLTVALGSSIADYVYSLESATAGAGVAWLKKHFPKQFDSGYQAYDAGSMQSVSGLTEHKMTGFNQWDEEWEVGGIDNATGQNTTASDRIRSKNYIPVLPSTAYYFKSANTLGLRLYDADKTFVDATAQTNMTYVIPANVRFVRFICLGTTTYNHDICINLSDPTKNGTYEPYEAHSYALDSDVVLRGIPKLDSNNKLYYDGDEYLPDGTVNRRWGVYTCTGQETLTTQQEKTNNKWISFVLPNAKLLSNVFSADFKTDMGVTYSDNINNDVAYGAFRRNTLFYVSFPISMTTSEMQAWIAGKTILYELETPTTETALPYQETQIVDDFGTEEFVLADGAFSVPVGHETYYQNNLRAKLEMSPDSPDGDGLYVVQQESGENTYVPLASTATIQDILTRLTALENA